jgi:hypothetical protein
MRADGEFGFRGRLDAVGRVRADLVCACGSIFDASGSA